MLGPISRQDAGWTGGVGGTTDKRKPATMETITHIYIYDMYIYI